MIRLSVAGVLGSAILLGGCAGLDYVKVPTPTQYGNWTDDNQRAADAMKGVRYYLPRPFLHLKQSTPVAQRTALVSFRYNPTDKAYVLEIPADQPTWVRKIAPARISITQALAATMAATDTNGKPSATKAQSGTPGGTGDGTQADATATPADAKPTAPTSPSEVHARTGYINDSDPVTRLGDRMDVVYLPDFEEQIVIKTKFGLGRADVETRLRNGWAAEVFAQKVDNSNLIPYVVDQVSKVSDAAAGIATTWMPAAMGLPPGTKMPAALKLQGGTGGGADGEQATRNFLGEVLVFKLAEVKTAQPGLYPILKPREVRQWWKGQVVVAGENPEESFDAFLRNAQTPWIRPDMAFIPCPPFTMIGFNVTTDVFLAPATGRIQEVAGIETDTSGIQLKSDASDVNFAKISEALRGKLSDLPAALQGKISVAKLSVSVGATAAKTRIAVVLKGDVDQTEQGKLKAWVEAVVPGAKGKVEKAGMGDEPTSTFVVQVDSTASALAASIAK